jgi:Pin2-interacting protein X1
MANLLLDKKTIYEMGSQMNLSASSKPSQYATKLMMKMGWKEGQGLGKNETGISTHIVISKREEKLGLGSESSAIAEEKDHWWHDAFSKNLANLKNKMTDFEENVDNSKNSDSEKQKKKNKKEKKKEKKEKKESKKSSKKRKRIAEEETNQTETSKKATINNIENSNHQNPIEMISYDELFRATGGARLGMRARRKQTGKILRTEGKEALLTEGQLFDFTSCV